jgi:glucose-6-phosphate isomerase
MSSLDTLTTLDAAARLAARDASLFSADPDVQREVTENLGWTHLAEEAASLMPNITELARVAVAEGLDDVVLLGMGGSSLASLVIGKVLAGDGASGPRLHVLDTTSPLTVTWTLSRLDFGTTLVLVSSKSGTTIEPLSLYAIMRAAADEALGREAAGRRFVAITDPGSHLETLAERDGFRSVVSSPPTVGGRYSALTVFGLVTAALLGIDLERLLAPARAMEAACHDRAGAENPGLALASFAVDAHADGRDKLTVVASEGLSSFGIWAEQLVAESLGKEGTGVLPVVELDPDKPLGYGRDRALAVVRFADDDRLAGWAPVAYALPVIELVLAIHGTWAPSSSAGNMRSRSWDRFLV